MVNQKVIPATWADAGNALQYVHTIKADENELAMLTGLKSVEDGIIKLSNCGVKEIIITNGSKGSLVYFDGQFYSIPAFAPANIVDATGCGDTYMAGYLYKKIKGSNIDECGRFAAAMASLKIEQYGPFAGDKNQVLNFLSKQ